jgi:glycosyltransferase involved in cell wall biosynthesis
VNILILHSQVPFVTGGAEVLVGGLARALRERGHLADIVALPLAWNPVGGLLTTALAWRLLDLTAYNDRRVDLVICTKYPTWAARHPRKTLWLIHQHRQAYDLYATPLSEFGQDAADRDTRERLVELDRIGIGECAPRYAISRNVSQRLKHYNGLSAPPLYPPLPRTGLRDEASEPYVLSAARLDAAKRVGPLIDAWSQVDDELRLIVVGDGPQRAMLEDSTRRRGLGERISFVGRVDDAQMTRLYNRCRAVYYAPLDEDFGYSAVEALAAGKPVVTAPDSGGVLEFVEHERSGLVTTLDPPTLASALNRLTDATTARQLGAAGPGLVADLSWDAVVERLTAV